MSSSSLLYPGFVLENRYEIVQTLGQGGFGRTYLAKDRNRFQERCVLKEFAPQVHGIYALKKAAELFQREAGVLYKLQHPQIPAFRELLQTKLNGEDCLLLIEDYVEGSTYADLLHQGKRFTEPEVIQLLQDLLPVLEYLHINGVIHRDVSPDNLICEQSTGQPMLIDFGSVKQVAATAVRQLNQQPFPTQIEKAGYTPIEQLSGKAFPSSDLYALGATILVLLTNKSPLELHDPHSRTWRWQPYIQLSSGLETILQHMLAERDVDRYQSAHEVKQALQALAYSGAIPAPASRVAVQQTPQPNPPAVSGMKTWVVAPARPPSRQPDPLPYQPLPPAHPASNQPPPAHVPSRQPLQWIGRSLFWLVTLPFRLVWWAFRLVNGVLTLVWRLAVITLVLGLLAIAAWLFKPAWLPTLPIVAKQDAGCQALISRMETLGMTKKALYPQVEQKWHSTHPELKGRELTAQPEDAQFRQEWCAMAEELLEATAEQRQ